MGYKWQRWLAAEYRAAGLTVVEIEGWRNRGRPASTGNFDPQGPSTVHHTGSQSSPSNPRPSLQTLITGRSDLPGPLCQKATDYNGVVLLIAAGRANHAGAVGKPGVPGMPLGADGNALALGNEVMTNGTQALTPAQVESIAIQTAVDLRHKGRDDVEFAHRHEDISGTGKWDIGSMTTARLRALVRDHMEEDDMSEYAEQLKRIEDGVDKAVRLAEKGNKGSFKRDKVEQRLIRELGVDADKLRQVLDRVEAEVAEDDG